MAEKQEQKFSFENQDISKMTPGQITKSILPNIREVGLYKKWLADKKEREPAERLRKDLTEMSKESRDKEKNLAQTLFSESSKTAGAVDNLLASLIDQTGYTAGLTKKAVGAQQADRGILRSGATAERLESVDVAKASRVAGLTAERNKQVRSVYDVRDNALRQVQDRRKTIQMQLKQAEAESMNSLAYQEKALKIKMEMKQFINDLNLSSQATKDTLAMLGGLGTLAGIGAGYYASSPSDNNTTFDTDTYEAPLDTTNIPTITG